MHDNFLSLSLLFCQLSKLLAVFGHVHPSCRSASLATARKENGGARRKKRGWAPADAHSKIALSNGLTMSVASALGEHHTQLGRTCRHEEWRDSQKVNAKACTRHTRTQTQKDAEQRRSYMAALRGMGRGRKCGGGRGSQHTASPHRHTHTNRTHTQRHTTRGVSVHEHKRTFCTYTHTQTRTFTPSSLVETCI